MRTGVVTVVQRVSTKTSLLAALASGLEDPRQTVVHVAVSTDRSTPIRKGHSCKIPSLPNERTLLYNVHDLMNFTQGEPPGNIILANATWSWGRTGTFKWLYLSIHNQ